MSSQAAPTLRASSTLVLLRDGSGGLEVHLSRRNPELRFMGGAWVFPGGSVDALDAPLHGTSLLQGVDSWFAKGPLQGLIPFDEAFRFLMSALRETLEEVGVLFAQPPPEGTEALRQAAQGGTLRGALGELGIILDPSPILPWGRWVTPKAFPRRFDTLFFVAPCPGDQEPIVDGGELVEGRWFRPEDALGLHLEGELPLAPPTLIALQDLSEIGAVADLPQAVVGRHLGPACPFALNVKAGARVLVMPGDKDHPEVPGPGLRRAVEIRPWVFRVEVSPKSGL